MFITYDTDNINTYLFEKDSIAGHIRLLWHSVVIKMLISLFLHAINVVNFAKGSAVIFGHFFVTVKLPRVGLCG